MTRRHRRAFLKLMLIAVGIPMVMAGSCATTSATTPQQVVDDCNNAVQALIVTFKQVVQTAPNAIPADLQGKITSALASATVLLGDLSANLAANVSAPIVQQIEQALNSVIVDAASMFVIPPPFSIALDAVAIVLPTIEAFVNSFIAQPTGQQQLVAARAQIAVNRRKLTIPDARAVLMKYAHS